MAETINVKHEKIKNKTGVWYYAGELLKKHGLNNTGRNQYQILVWLEKENKNKIIDHHIQKNALLIVPANKNDVIRICSLKLSMNEKKEMKIEDSYSIRFPNYELYKTDHKPGCNSDDTIAADMLVNDFNEKKLLEYSSLFANELEIFKMYSKKEECVKYLVTNFKLMVSIFFTDKIFEQAVYAQIDKFISGDDKSDFTDTALSNSAKEHERTQELIKKVKKALLVMLRNVDGDLNQLCLVNLQEKNNELYKTLHWGTANENDWTPSFSTKKDRKQGLKIAVNDVWGYTINIKNYRLANNRQFSCELYFSMFDHFGLDEDDLKTNLKEQTVRKIGEQTIKRSLAGFRAWFFLQHFVGFEGKYKPFITRMNFSIPFSDRL